MAHFTTSIDTGTAAQDAFRYIADFSNVADWDPTVRSARRVSRGPLGVGDRFEVLMDTPIRPFPFHYEILRYEPDHLIVLEAESDLLRSLDTIEIEPRARGCRVHYDADLRLRRGFYLFDLAAHLAFQFSGRSSARGLGQALNRLS
ncbi:MAG: SRPBCC family protein [Myxococcota bacterium]